MLDFLALAAARLLAAGLSPIPDCDEVFNYWEPTHFLTHGSGLQTWEWSPAYAIRSWAYVGLHAAVVRAGALAGLQGASLFYFLRAVLACVEGWTEARLARAVRRRYGSTANIYVILSALCTGLFHASVSYLPSSFAMYCVTFAMSQFLLDPRKHIRSALLAIVVGAVLGWPFVLILVAPIGLYYSFSMVESPRAWFEAMSKTALASVGVLGTVAAIDSTLYRRFVVVPFNIVAYNVFFASDDAGPNIFGTEPWTYYILNLLLNFNLMVPLSLLAFFVVDSRSATVLSTFALWIAILIIQPHKEERFIYPVYPLICLGASFALSRFWGLATKFIKLPRALLYGAVGMISTISVLRTLALVLYYTAPLRAYNGAASGSTVCVGREWYRFPSSYFIDGNLNFVQSGFNGLLPGHFQSIAGIPDGMNNQNAADPGKLVPVSSCEYYVDIKKPVNKDEGEIDPATDSIWTEEVCYRFLDTDESSTLARILYLPLNNLLGTTSWTEYCRWVKNDRGPAGAQQVGI